MKQLNLIPSRLRTEGDDYYQFQRTLNKMRIESRMISSSFVQIFLVSIVEMHWHSAKRALDERMAEFKRNPKVNHYELKKSINLFDKKLKFLVSQTKTYELNDLDWLIGMCMPSLLKHYKEVNLIYRIQQSFRDCCRVEMKEYERYQKDAIMNHMNDESLLNIALDLYAASGYICILLGQYNGIADMARGYGLKFTNHNIRTDFETLVRGMNGMIFGINLCDEGLCDDYFWKQSQEAIIKVAEKLQGEFVADTANKCCERSIEDFQRWTLGMMVLMQKDGIPADVKADVIKLIGGAEWLRFDSELAHIFKSYDGDMAEPMDAYEHLMECDEPEDSAIRKYAKACNEVYENHLKKREQLREEVEKRCV